MKRGRGASLCGVVAVVLVAGACSAIDGLRQVGLLNSVQSRVRNAVRR